MESNHVLICDTNNLNVLATQSGYLPLVHFDGTYGRDPEGLCALVQKSFNLPFRVEFLRREAEGLYKGPRCSYYTAFIFIFHVPYEDVTDPPKSYKWVPLCDVDKIEVEPSRKPVVDFVEKFKVHGLDVHCDRLWPYSRAEWFAEACEWMKDELCRCMKVTVSDIAKVAVSSSGCVLRGRVAGGTQKFYLKGVLPEKGDEVQVACALSKIMPQYFRSPIAVEEGRRWMLMEDFGVVMSKEECSMSKNLDTFRKVLGDWGSIQVESVDVVDDLVRAGVRMQGAKELKEKLEEIVRDPAWYEAQVQEIKARRLEELPEEEYKLKFLSYVDRVLEKVSEFNVPLALVHGDLNAENMTRREDRSVTYFDFEGTVIGFPFLDAIRFSFVCNGYKDVEFDDLLFYYQRWTKYESVERLKELHTVLEDVRSLEGVCLRHEMWSKAEESEKLLAFREMGFPVSYKF